MSLISFQFLLQMFYNVTSPGIEVRQGDILVSGIETEAVWFVAKPS